MSKRNQEKKEEELKENAKCKLHWTWKEDPGVIYGDCGTTPSELILASDMDGTLIKPKSNAKFAKDANDWVWLNNKVISTLEEYHKKGYKIVIITNQGGIEKGHTQKNDIMTKIQNMTEQIGFPIQAIISPNKDHYHKPGLGMWEQLEKMNGDKTVKLAESFYLGDAAGRPKSGSRPADFDNTDQQDNCYRQLILYKFALNVGVQFKTPEEFFLGQKETIPALDFDPKAIKKTGNVLKGKDNSKIKSGAKEMIIFVGSPGSGKSTFWHNYLSDYVRVNNDTLKSKDKCKKAAREAMQTGKSLVIDNTNPSKAVRKEYIDLAKEFSYPVRCFYFDVPKPIAFHLDNQREMNKHHNHHSGRVGSMVIHGFYKNMEPPTKDEGFVEVDIVELVAGPFHNKDDERLFFSHVSSKK